jgi:hypothetical protein
MGFLQISFKLFRSISVLQENKAGHAEKKEGGAKKD